MMFFIIFFVGVGVGIAIGVFVGLRVLDWLVGKELDEMKKT